MWVSASGKSKFHINHLSFLEKHYLKHHECTWVICCQYFISDIKLRWLRAYTNGNIFSYSADTCQLLICLFICDQQWNLTYRMEEIVCRWTTYLFCSSYSFSEKVNLCLIYFWQIARFYANWAAIEENNQHDVNISWHI